MRRSPSAPWSIVGVLVSLMTASCGQVNAPGQVVPGTRGPYLGLAVLSNGAIVLDRYVVTARGETSVEVRDSITAPPRTLALPSDPACWKEEWLSPTALPNGHLGMIHICAHSVEGNPPAEASVANVDLATGSTTRLMALAPLGLTEGVTFTVTPDSQTVYYDLGGLLCTKLIRATSQNATGRVDAVVQSGGQRFSLEEPQALNDCDGGRAGLPALAPDGRTLAFFASPATIGAPEGPNRLSIPWNLYVLEPGSAGPRELASGYTNVQAPRWSPNGAALIFDRAVSSGRTRTLAPAN